MFLGDGVCCFLRNYELLASLRAAVSYSWVLWREELQLLLQLHLHAVLRGRVFPRHRRRDRDLEEPGVHRRQVLFVLNTLYTCT